ncbi:hypothetical protein COLO4_00124 [Corchorus olitorius]|uniref:Uncharacterized protein n=1 Tax=Corchorus olitorius TaxID=93759 RepID=A0A1R3L4L1_9ROSI|nr:hypothetical protein COLO4_22918 [Corchorus olitorius]OMP12768.1 hypothetical protein COLO4_02782 [Corchorus olitorius]OMP14257.1 hypothetical protein COLO4_00124 [Corchorus olitorius]
MADPVKLNMKLYIRNLSSVEKGAILFWKLSM